MNKRVYLDHNATTPLHPEVKETLTGAMEVFGNPSSLHSFGREARAMLEKAREELAGFIGAHPEEIIFSGSGSEANNTVFNVLFCDSCCEAVCPKKKRTEIITSRIEHPCVLESAACMKEKGHKVHFLDVDRTGKVDMGQLEDLISDRTGIVSVMTANNEVGTVQEVARIARICREHGALFHTDAVQAVGKIPVDVREIEADYLTFSAHKIYGPKGIGGLYIRKGAPFCPFIRGGHQERGRRAGTENMLGIAGFGKAIELRKREMAGEAERLKTLKKYITKRVPEVIPDVSFNGHPVDSLPGVMNMSFAGAEGEAILLYLDLEGIAVSTGSACASGSLDPSHVLIACGITAEEAHGSIRVSMGRDTTREEIEYFIEKLTAVISRVRSISSV